MKLGGLIFVVIRCDCNQLYGQIPSTESDTYSSAYVNEGNSNTTSVGPAGRSQAWHPIKGQQSLGLCEIDLGPSVLVDFLPC